MELAPNLAGELVRGGTIVASGIFIDREPEVREAFAAAGLGVTGRWHETDWVALEAVREG